MKTKLVIFGITGDLASRKLLSALSHIIESAEFSDLSIIGVSRRHVEACQVLGNHHDTLAGTTSMFTMGLADVSEYTRLREHDKSGKIDISNNRINIHLTSSQRLRDCTESFFYHALGGKNAPWLENKISPPRCFR